MKFFLDNTFSPREARSFAALFAPDLEIVHLRETWPQDAKDEEWLPALIREGDWVILTHDRSIRRDHEYIVDTLRTSSCVAIFLAKSWQEMRLVSRHAKLLLYFERMVAEVAKSRRGTVLHLGPRGKLRRDR